MAFRPGTDVGENRNADPDAIPCRARHDAVPEPEATVDQRGLVERAREGDHDAFTELARGAATRLDRAARLILRDPELARDARSEERRVGKECRSRGSPQH